MQAALFLFSCTPAEPILRKMHILILDGSPDTNQLTSDLLNLYQVVLAPGDEVDEISVRDLQLGPVLHHGSAKLTEWEPDLHRVAALLDACDHLVVAFPMWSGSEPPHLKGLLDHLLLPGLTLAYHDDETGATN